MMLLVVQWGVQWGVQWVVQWLKWFVFHFYALYKRTLARQQHRDNQFAEESTSNEFSGMV